MRVVTLLVRHGIETLVEAPAEVAEVFARLGPACAHELRVIDNALPEGSQPDPTGAAGEAIEPGDNRCWEFSGWDAALRTLGPALHDFDLVHLATSAYRQLPPDFWARTSAPVLEVMRGSPAVLGHLDCFQAPVRVGPYSTQHWVRTSWFFLRPQDLAALGSLVTFDDPSEFFCDDPADPFLPEAPLCPGLRRILLDWLTGAGLGQGTRWHSRFDLVPATMGRFRMKALAILNELFLSIRLRALAIEPLDLTWLRGLIDAGAPPPVPTGVPWRSQLRERTRDMVDPK